MASVCRKTHRFAASEVGIPVGANADGPLGVSDRSSVEWKYALMAGSLNGMRYRTSGGWAIPWREISQIAPSSEIRSNLQINTIKESIHALRNIAAAESIIVTRPPVNSRGLCHP